MLSVLFGLLQLWRNKSLGEMLRPPIANAIHYGSLLRIVHLVVALGASEVDAFGLTLLCWSTYLRPMVFWHAGSTVELIQVLRKEGLCSIVYYPLLQQMATLRSYAMWSIKTTDVTKDIAEKSGKQSMESATLAVRSQQECITKLEEELASQRQALGTLKDQSAASWTGIDSRITSLTEECEQKFNNIYSSLETQAKLTSSSQRALQDQEESCGRRCSISHQA